MRGADITQESSFTTAALANFVPQHHTLREIRALVDEALGKMNSVFSTLYPQAAAGKVRPERARGPEKGDCQTKTRGLKTHRRVGRAAMASITARISTAC